MTISRFNQGVTSGLLKLEQLLTWGCPLLILGFQRGWWRYRIWRLESQSCWEGELQPYSMRPLKSLFFLISLPASHLHGSGCAWFSGIHLQRVRTIRNLFDVSSHGRTVNMTSHICVAGIRPAGYISTKRLAQEAKPDVQQAKHSTACSNNSTSQCILTRYVN